MCRLFDNYALAHGVAFMRNLYSVVLNHTTTSSDSFPSNLLNTLLSDEVEFETDSCQVIGVRQNLPQALI